MMASLALSRGQSVGGAGGRAVKDGYVHGDKTEGGVRLAWQLGSHLVD